MRKSNRSGSMDSMMAVLFLAVVLAYHLTVISSQLEYINKNIAEQNKILIEQSKKINH